MKKTYYHLSMNIEHTGSFQVRVPEVRMQDEDHTTERICVSESVVGCLNAFPDSVERSPGAYIKVFEIIPEELGFSTENLLSPEYLYENDLVNDALLTREYWVTKSFEVPKERQSIIKLSYIEQSLRLVLPYPQVVSLNNTYQKEIEAFKENECMDTDTPISYLDTMSFADIYLQEELEGKEENLLFVSHITEFDFMIEQCEDVQEIWFSTPHTKQLIEYAEKSIPGVMILEVYQDECRLAFPSRTNLKDLYLFDHSINKNSEQGEVN